MKRLYSMLALMCCAGIFMIVAAIPKRQANLAYVRSTTAVKVMQELNDPGISIRIQARPAGIRGVSFVSGREEELFEGEKQGLRTETRTTYSFNGLANSYCAEFLPGCLKIDHGQITKVISVEVPM